ncbi:MAG: DUF87 domain-containing protein [Pseudomonadota bacterium]
MDGSNRLFGAAQARQSSPQDADAAPTAQSLGKTVGEVVEVQGRSCVCAFDDHVRMVAGDDDAAQGQVVGQLGSFIKFRVGERLVFAVVRTLRSVGIGADMTMFGELDFIGELIPNAAFEDGYVFRRGVTKYPMPGQKLYVATGKDMRIIFAPTGKAHVNIGYVYPTDTVKASIDVDAVLSRHMAVLGSTGTGKSTVVAMLLRKIVEQSSFGHVLIFDPHDEYATAFKEYGVRHDTTNLTLPFWLMNLEEHVEVLVGARTEDREVDIDILKRVLIAARRKGKSQQSAAKITADSPVPYMLADFLNELQRNMGKLEKPEKMAPYMRLKAKIEELRSDNRYSFMFSGLVVNDDFSEMVSNLFRMPANGKPVSILDLSGVPSDVVNVVVSVLSRIAFDFARIARDNGNCRPLLLVCEEAHRYVPENPGVHMAVKRVLDKIAKEGRKYGVSLCLVTQRPSDISESILSQCGTMLSLRLNNERDQRFVEKSIPDGAESFLAVLPSLRNRECILVGEGIAAPSRVLIYDMESENRPNSVNPSFVSIWNEAETSAEFVTDIINAWRGELSEAAPKTTAYK